MTRPVTRPGVGSVVHYVSYGTPGGEYRSECRAAVVTELCDNPGGLDPETGTECVGLFVANPTGLFLNRHIPYHGGDVGHDHTGAAVPNLSYRGGTWHWPELPEDGDDRESAAAPQLGHVSAADRALVTRATSRVTRPGEPRPLDDGESDGEVLARLGTDARTWAREFVERFIGERVGDRPDEGTLLAWFATAIESGRTAGLPAHARPGNSTHPESYCHRCGGPNTVWVAPSPLWNSVMRGGDSRAADDFDGIVCPTCFTELAEERGVARDWRLTARDVRVELPLTTYDGRVWDDERWLFVDPEAAAG